MSKLDLKILLNISHLFLSKSSLVEKQYKNCISKDKTLNASKPLELVHINICGSMQTKSIKNFTYFVINIDDCLRFMAIYSLKHK